MTNLEVFMNRRLFLAGAAAALVPTAGTGATETTDLKPVFTEIEKRHDESVRRIQDWIKQPTIAAENKGINEGRDLMMRLLKEVGCNQVTACPTDLHPGVFGILDVGAPKTLAVYFMHDVKQVDPSEWSSPPFTPLLSTNPVWAKSRPAGARAIRKGLKGRSLPPSMRFAALVASCRSTLCSSAKVRRKSGPHTLHRSCAARRCWRQCANAQPS